MSRFTSGRFGAASVLALPVLLLDFVAWILLLAGVSALQHQCSSQAEVLNSTSPIRQIFPASTCRNVDRFQWWILWLQFVILVGESCATLLLHLLCKCCPAVRWPLPQFWCLLHFAAIYHE